MGQDDGLGAAAKPSSEVFRIEVECPRVDIDQKWVGANQGHCVKKGRAHIAWKGDTVASADIERQKGKV
jgi:hypothetical protein